MDVYILKCCKCGQIYKATSKNGKLVTDCGDDITDCCVKCKCADRKMIKTDDWIADLVFKIKGER